MNLAQMQADYQAEVAYRQHWAARVRALRKRLGLTQKQFGERIGCHEHTIYHFESGAGVYERYEPLIEALERETSG